MSEIADLLQQKAGLDPDKAQEVEQLILQHITSRIPPEFQTALASILGPDASNADGSAGTAGSGGLGSLLSAASSFLSKKE